MGERTSPGGVLSVSHALDLMRDSGCTTLRTEEGLVLRDNGRNPVVELNMNNNTALIKGAIGILPEYEHLFIALRAENISLDIT